LIDVLLVLLVIFYDHSAQAERYDGGFAAGPATRGTSDPPDTAIVIQVLADGSLRINQESVKLGTG